MEGGRPLPLLLPQPFVSGSLAPGARTAQVFRDDLTVLTLHKGFESTGDFPRVGLLLDDLGKMLRRGDLQPAGSAGSAHFCVKTPTSWPLSVREASGAMNVRPSE